MANAALEKFVLKLSVPVFLTAFVLVLIFLSHSVAVLLLSFAGFALSILLFESTAALYGSFHRSGSWLTAAAVLFLVTTSGVLLLSIWFTVRQGMDWFWGLFSGLMAVPAAIILYIFMEATGVTHTGFFT
ncbi:MAG: hypothetical protein IJ720_03350 [Clostridia bacterium]|nr:hypothetical protein [Clostridia bacterium]MBR1704383.1 hypothetical protein [Clostridia bacterium]